MSGDRDLSHFDEKSGVVACQTPWGRWWQTVHEVHVEVKLPDNTKAKQIAIKCKTREIECIICGEVLLKGLLPLPVHPDDMVWTVERGAGGSTLCIVLSKADHSIHDNMWETLVIDNDSVKPDPLTAHEMRKKLDLERFQIENPGMDFSGAKLAKSYDNLPGWSTEKLKQKKEEEEAETKLDSSGS